LRAIGVTHLADRNRTRDRVAMGDARRISRSGYPLPLRTCDRPSPRQGGAIRLYRTCSGPRYAARYAARRGYAVLGN